MRVYRGLLSRLAHGDAPSSSSDGILAHLQCLLNTRYGSAPAAPELGVDDITDLLGQFPRAAEILGESIQKVIERYEPRLCDVQVIQRDSGSPLALQFEILGRVVGEGVLRCQTRVRSNGRVEVW